MRAFHLSWLAFFSTFVSTFGPAALITIIREDLDMTKTDIGNAGIAAVCGAIFGRIAFGNFIDVYGARRFTNGLPLISVVVALPPRKRTLLAVAWAPNPRTCSLLQGRATAWRWSRS
jgi:nitrate/nitrite transporter NarK